MRRFAAILLGLVLIGGGTRAFAGGFTVGEGQKRGDSLGADWAQQQEEARKAVREGRHLPLSEVVTRINAQIPGRILDTGLESDEGGRPVYRVRWAAKDGRRLDIIADARTGQIVRQEGR